MVGGTKALFKGCHQNSPESLKREYSEGSDPVKQPILSMSIKDRSMTNLFRTIFSRNC